MAYLENKIGGGLLYPKIIFGMSKFGIHEKFMGFFLENGGGWGLNSQKVNFQKLTQTILVLSY